MEGLSVRADMREAGELYAKGYGEVEGDHLILSPQEALFLAEARRLRVYSRDGAELEPTQLLGYYSKAVENFWLLYVVYRDLRRRGYVVKAGFGGGLAYRVYEKGRRDYSRYLVFPFFEGSPILVSSLAESARQAMAKGRSLVVAVVERRGEVIYYSCAETDLENV